MSRFVPSDVFDLLFIFPYVSCFRLVGCGWSGWWNEDTQLRFAWVKGRKEGRKGVSWLHHGLVLAWNVCLWAKAWRSFVGRRVFPFDSDTKTWDFWFYVWRRRRREDLGMCVGSFFFGMGWMWVDRVGWRLALLLIPFIFRSGLSDVSENCGYQCWCWLSQADIPKKGWLLWWLITAVDTGTVNSTYLPHFHLNIHIDKFLKASQGIPRVNAKLRLIASCVTFCEWRWWILNWKCGFVYSCPLTVAFISTLLY